MPADALFDVSREVVVITGVNGQLGRFYAESFLARGAKVAGIDLGEAKFKSEHFFHCKTDITNKAALEETLSQITQRFGTPTVLINNAAIDSPPSAPLEENGPYATYPETSWDKVMDVNVKGTHLTCQVLGDAMAKAGKGSIINIASIYGVVSPDQSLYEYRRARGETFFKPAAYAASKAAVIQLSRYLATYWAKQGVRVNSLTLAGVFNSQEQAFLEAYCARIPMGRMAEAKDYEGAVLFLASDASRYMTGSNLVIDGGWTAI